MKSLVTATAKSLNKTIECEITVDGHGDWDSEYKIDNNSKDQYFLVLTPTQVKNELGVKVAKNTNILIDGGKKAFWDAVKAAQKITDLIESAKADKEWAAMLKNNETLTLYQRDHTCIISLPKALTEHTKILKKVLNFTWDHNKDIFSLTITAKELAQLLEAGNTEKKQTEKNEKAKITKAQKKANTTGKDQVIYEGSDECDDDSEGCDIDNITGYIRLDGSTYELREHTW